MPTPSFLQNFRKLSDGWYTRRQLAEAFDLKRVDEAVMRCVENNTVDVRRKEGTGEAVIYEYRVRPYSQTSKRPCLTCQRPFLSEGIHNRICTNCKETVEFNGIAMVSMI